MPKIHTKTLAEQREWRRNQLIDAAAEIAMESGAKSLTVSAVAKRAGVSRTAVYDYFESTTDLVSELVYQELSNYAELLNQACSKESGAIEKISAWTTAALAYVADGRHLLVKALNATSFPQSRSSEIALAHRKMLAPLNDALLQIGINDQSVLDYIKAISDAAATRIEQGHPADQEIKYALDFLIAGIKSAATNSTLKL
jgi:AcrR family transcriptional regulator